MEEQVILGINENINSDPYIEDLADHLFEKFKNHPETYLREHFSDVIIEYLVDKMNVKYLGKINKDGFERAIKQVENLSSKEIERGLDHINIENALKKETVDKISSGIEALRSINNGILIAVDFTNMYESIQRYKENQDDKQLMVNAVTIGLDAVGSLAGTFGGPIGIACELILNIGAALTQTAFSIVSTYYDRLVLFEKQCEAYAAAKNAKEADRIMQELLETRDLKGYLEFKEKEALCKYLEENFGYLGGIFQDYEPIESALNQIPGYSEKLSQIQKKVKNIESLYHEATSGVDGKELYDDYSFGENGVIKDIKDGVDDASKERPVDPLIFDIDGDGLKPTGILDGTYFDLDGNGKKERMSWIRGDGLLVYDRDGNGLIDDGKELFSNFTVLANGTLAKSGLQALAEFDENKDGVIDEKDSIFSQLRFWMDNGDGISEGGELKTLKELGIKSISLKTSGIIENINGIEIRNQGSYTKEDGSTGTYGEIWSKPNYADSIEKEAVEVSEEVEALANVRSIGNLATLHQAMMKDETGRIKEIVKSIGATEDVGEKLALTKQLLLIMSNAESITTGSRGSYIDAKELAVIEAFLGEKYVGVSGSNPNNAAASILKKSYQDIIKTYLSFIMLDSELEHLRSYLNVSEEGKLEVNFTSLHYYLKFKEVNGTSITKDLKGIAYVISGFDTNNQLFNQFLGLYQDTKYEETIIEGHAKVIRGSSGNDNLAGTGENDYLVGGAGNDTLSGGNGNDILRGDVGNDSLSAGNGNDHLDGGTGNDSLTGGAGNDLYVYRKGDGNDTIFDREGINTLRLLDITPEELGFRHVSIGGYPSLEIRIISTGEKIVLRDYYYPTESKNFRIEFSDGTLWEPEEVNQHAIVQVITEGDDVIKMNQPEGMEIHGYGGNDSLTGNVGDDILHGDAGNDSLYGNGGNDTLYGGDGNDALDGGHGNDGLYGGSGNDTVYGNGGNDTLDGGTGNDTLYGGAGNDLYFYRKGDGNDTILDREGINTLRLLDITPEELGFRHVSIGGYPSLEIRIISTGEKIVLRDYYYPTESKNFRIEFSDGTLWEPEEVNQHAIVQVITEGDDVIKMNQPEGMEIHGYGGNDSLTGNVGDDILHGDAGNDSLYGNGGNDTLYGGDGNDALNGGYGNDALYGGSGADNLTGDNGDDLLEGGSENDSLSAGNGNDHLDGGTGNDSLTGGAGNDLYVYRKGDGNDTIFDREGINTLRLLDITPEELEFRHIAIDWYPSLEMRIISTGEKIVLKGHYYDTESKNFRIEFSDGTVWEPEELNQHAMVHVTTEGDDIIRMNQSQGMELHGYGGNDSLSGNVGDDTLYGGGGNDTLNGGYGNDALYGGSGADNLTGGSGDDLLEGGSENDSLYGGAGNDLYVYRKGDGNDTILDAEGNNELQLKDILSSDLSFKKVGNDLIIGFKDQTEFIKLQNYEYSSSYRNIKLSFDDGSVYTERLTEGMVLSTNTVSLMKQTYCMSTEDQVLVNENILDKEGEAPLADVVYG